mmetsp:Transcript_26333/g.56785  ORF Transcript_26333/g.56785 Transcript_26333/m.56785 type:complete len:333 (+) Transcript_26333:679-1677(+)
MMVILVLLPPLRDSAAVVVDAEQTPEEDAQYQIEIVLRYEVDGAHAQSRQRHHAHHGTRTSPQKQMPFLLSIVFSVLAVGLLVKFRIGLELGVHSTFVGFHSVPEHAAARGAAADDAACAYGIVVIFIVHSRQKVIAIFIILIISIIIMPHVDGPTALLGGYRGRISPGVHQVPPPVVADIPSRAAEPVIVPTTITPMRHPKQTARHLIVHLHRRPSRSNMLLMPDIHDAHPPWLGIVAIATAILVPFRIVGWSEGHGVIRLIIRCWYLTVFVEFVDEALDSRIGGDAPSWLLLVVDVGLSTAAEVAFVVYWIVFAHWILFILFEYIIYRSI